MGRRARLLKRVFLVVLIAAAVCFSGCATAPSPVPSSTAAPSTPEGPRLEGQAPIPLDTPDPRYAEYFRELKRRIEANWDYPAPALRSGQSGRGVIGFILRKDGSVLKVDVLRSSGIRILDQYIENAIRFASPFPPIPGNIPADAIPISVNFIYTIGAAPSPPPE